MTDYENKLAELFKNLENPTRIGSVIGSVISSFPNFKVSILNGSIILYPDQLYINDILYDIGVLKVGDLVKVTPTESEQVWFIDYKVRKVGD